MPALVSVAMLPLAALALILIPNALAAEACVDGDQEVSSVDQGCEPPTCHYLYVPDSYFICTSGSQYAACLSSAQIVGLEGECDLEYPGPPPGCAATQPPTPLTDTDVQDNIIFCGR